jgi:hypothetical protein
MPRLVELLEPHQESLEELDLDMGIMLEPDNWWRPEPLPSLRQFCRLRKITASSHTWSDILEKYSPLSDPLSGHHETLCDRLPLSLETLRVSETDPYYEFTRDYQQIERLVFEGRTTLKNLTTVEVVEKTGVIMRVPR